MADVEKHRHTDKDVANLTANEGLITLVLQLFSGLAFSAIIGSTLCFRLCADCQVYIVIVVGVCAGIPNATIEQLYSSIYTFR